MCQNTRQSASSTASSPKVESQPKHTAVKVTQVSRYRFNEAHRHLCIVLSEVKSRKLTKGQLNVMKTFEEAVQGLEAVNLYLK